MLVTPWLAVQLCNYKCDNRWKNNVAGKCGICCVIFMGESLEMLDCMWNYVGYPSG